ncbi:hypothetical protein BofuT4_uP128720.1 [Botrytis cinerea T4]|uniref:Uncharacterized protein n=1 Tax=Botryotinia fuckeliana (strain T4) TaxID=999810 RepID=G2YRC4_BOTF4|nr:hypothetical protein BofuT4_uP128720.1 [Botrytis cinerea T4]
MFVAMITSVFEKALLDSGSVKIHLNVNLMEIAFLFECQDSALKRDPWSFS